MTANPPELPLHVVRNLAAMGEAGNAWLAGLPALIAELQGRWDVVIGKTMSNATEAYVAEAMSAHGERAVLKVPTPGDERA